jgi:Chaperone of endosialidase
MRFAMSVSRLCLLAFLVCVAPAAAQLTPNLIYTSVQPCRLFDTRLAGGALSANASRQFNVVGGGNLSGQGGNSSGCPIPGFDANSLAQVQAVVVNLAVITPSGTGVLQAWPSDQSQPNASVMNFTTAEVVLANGVVLPVRQDSQGGDITLVSNVATHVLGDVVGYFCAGSPVQGSGIGNLFLGVLAGNQFGMTGTGNTGIGYESAFLLQNGASFNTATGYGALFDNTAGNNNTGVGSVALELLATGSNNTGVGASAGIAYTGSESNNIVIGNTGTVGESGVIRIGTGGTHTQAFIAGISGATSSGGTEVFVNASGQLGTATSSLRFKEDVADMGEASAGLMQLRPVTFRYKAPYDDGSRLLQYGLIAEEVAKIYPDLVQYDEQGRPAAVRYHFVNAMLLNEVQKQNTRIEALETRQAGMEALQTEVATQRAQIEELQRQVQRLLQARPAIGSNAHPGE